MKLSFVLFFIVVFTCTVFAQPETSLVKLKGRFDFENPAETIIAYRFLDGGSKLWLLGKSTIQVWDVPEKKVISSTRHDIASLSYGVFKSLSPDGRKLLTESYKDENKVFHPAIVVDLTTFKIVKVFDKTMQRGYWSRDGSVFVAINEGVKINDDSPVKESEVFFSNGDTFEPLNAIKVKDLDWNYLTPDGGQFFTTSVPTKKWLFGIPYSNGMANLISIWNTRTGENEKNLSVGGEDFAVLTWKLMPSPSGKYMAMVSKHRSKDEEHKIIFWELGGKDSPKYTLRANPRIRDSNIRYSPDEKLFAVDAGKNIQIYQSESGQKKGEVLDSALPDYWLADNQILINVFLGKMRAYNAVSGSKIYENPLYYDSYENVISSTTDANGNTSDSTETVITDQTTVVPHPDSKIFLTHSNQFVKLYNVQNGEFLETVVRPPLSLVKQKYAIREKTYVADAGWTNDGRTMFVIEGDKTAITLWDFTGN